MIPDRGLSLGAELSVVPSSLIVARRRLFPRITCSRHFIAPRIESAHIGGIERLRSPLYYPTPVRKFPFEVLDLRHEKSLQEALN